MTLRQALASRSFRFLAVPVVLGVLAAQLLLVGAPAGASAPVRPRATGSLDCNGLSPIQRPVKLTSACSDPKGYDGGRFYDNGKYVGHDEPIIRFLSSQPGSGNDVTWNERLSVEPSRLPTVRNPGSDVTHNFELSLAPWFSMALCNQQSYPQLPCTPNSDRNAASGRFPGGGSSFLEMQFYPPGFAPFVDNISCDNTHWCASLHINDVECTDEFASCNRNCIEPTNFAFIQRDGVPTGPPSPQLANVSSFTPNRQTLLMNPGDDLKIRIFDADIGHGQHALETRIVDRTTGQSGYMVASAANGFMSTSIVDCSGTPFNYEPEYSTAGSKETIPWAALETNISTQFEIGHFTPCGSIKGPVPYVFGSFTDTYWKHCTGPYERTTVADTPAGNPEPNDAPCYFFGDTHNGTAPPNLVTGCDNFFTVNGDIDFDGTSYWPDWPDSTTPDRFPSTFQQQQPTTRGSQYPQIQFQTDAAASEVSCQPTGKGCAVPPPGAPGHFYPYWTQAMVGGQCVWEFGQMRNGNTFGGASQYGQPKLSWFFGNLEGKVRPNPYCGAAG